MYFKDIKKIEEIYPLTIVSRRYGGFSILNCNSCSKCASSIEEGENIMGNEEDFMDKNWPHIKYGIGDSIELAFEDYKKKK